MEETRNTERRGKDDVELPSSQPREEKKISDAGTPAAPEKKKRPDVSGTPETGPGGE